MSLVPRIPLDVAHGLLSAAWRRRYLIAVPILVMPVLAAVAGMMAPKSYKARMSVLVQEAAVLNPFLKDLVVATNLKERMNSLGALLKSRQLLGQVALDLKWIREDSSPVEQDRTIAFLGRMLDVELIGKELIEIRYRADSPKGMDQVLLATSRRFMERVLAPERTSLRGSESFLRTQLEQISVDLETAESALARFKTENADKLPELHSSNVARLAALRRDLSSKAMDLAGAKATLESVRSRLADTNPVVGQIEQKIVETVGGLAVLRARYTDEHYEVAALKRRLGRLQQERADILLAARDLKLVDIDRLWNIAVSGENRDGKATQPLMVAQLQQLQDAQARIQSLTQEVATVEADVKQVEAMVVAFGEVERTLKRLEREVAMKRQLHDGLKERFQMARVTADLGAFEAPERIRVIDMPVEPTAPTTPGLVLFLAAGIFGGIALGIGLAAFAEVADGTVRSAKQLADLTGLPVLTRMPSLGAPAPATAPPLSLSIFKGMFR